MLTRAGSYVASAALAIALLGCANGTDGGTDGGNPDASVTDPRADASAAGDGDALMDAPPMTDAGGNADASDTIDALAPSPDAAPDAMVGIITGGPCLSGAPGATAYRVRWADGGGAAYPVYEVNGLPDTSRDHVGAYGYQIGFTPSYVDTFLAQGGLQLDSSSFVDIELSTAGVSQITTATLSIYGRSYNTTTSGSFNWQTFAGVGAAPTNLVSNSAPYEWYSADMTTEIDPGDDGVLLRIKAGPSSGSLVVNRIELCVQAN
ncbi:MAG TPA: hypothetical protein VML75_17995 [Kofleriaceae bacterium]|nr:hypothetical protein [Kofleriaceae bacterium]